MQTGVLSRCVDLLFPAECAGCREFTDQPWGLCPTCWSDTHFITGPSCRLCGVPIATAGPETEPICEACTAEPPGWVRGRAAVLYDGTARDVILRFKHRGRTELAPMLSKWVMRAAGDLLAEPGLIVPVPLHWSRLFRRRFNQSALLAHRLSDGSPRRFVPDLLLRTRATKSLSGLTRDLRRAELDAAIQVHPKHRDAVPEARVLLIDDVMTTGATLRAATEVLMAAGAARVDVAVVARVAQEDFLSI